MDIGSSIKNESLRTSNSAHSNEKGVNQASNKNQAYNQVASTFDTQVNASKAQQEQAFNAIEESRLQQERREKAKIEEDLKAKEAREESLKHAKEVIAKLNQRQISLRFEFSEEFSDRQVVNVIDIKQDEVVRQIPSEEFLRIADNIAKYNERIKHDEMVADPVLKAFGVDTTNANESLRGAVIDNLV